MRDERAPSQESQPGPERFYQWSPAPASRTPSQLHSVMRIVPLGQTSTPALQTGNVSGPSHCPPISPAVQRIPDVVGSGHESEHPPCNATRSTAEQNRILSSTGSPFHDSPGRKSRLCPTEIEAAQRASPRSSHSPHARLRHHPAANHQSPDAYLNTAGWPVQASTECQTLPLRGRRFF